MFHRIYRSSDSDKYFAKGIETDLAIVKSTISPSVFLASQCYLRDYLTLPYFIQSKRQSKRLADKQCSQPGLVCNEWLGCLSCSCLYFVCCSCLYFVCLFWFDFLIHSVDNFLDLKKKKSFRTRGRFWKNVFSCSYFVFLLLIF